MKRMSTWDVVPVIATLLLSMSSPTIAGTKVGDKAPDFSATTLDGRKVALSNYMGKKPLYLVFWATWCPNCQKEIPEINTLHEKFGNRLAILAINVGINDSANAARKYGKEHGMQYAIIFDKGSAITTAYGIVGTPTQILVGADGIIRYRSSRTPAAADIKAHWDILVGKKK